MSNDLMRDIAQLRRDMPRNATVMRVCDALEVELTSLTQQELNAAVAVVKKHKESFDRNGYQRDLMRQRRAKKEANG